jgi:TonB family protein
MFHSASQYIKNQPSNLSSPSVISNGQQILTPTPAKNLSALLTNSLPVLKDTAFTSEHGDSHATNIDSVAKDKAAITSFTKPRIATDTSANVNRLSVLSDDKVSVTKVFTEPKTLVLDTTQKSSSLLVIESQQPSISARAFIQTDSKNLQSALANPYLNEVIELASEPTFNSEFASVDSSATSELASVTAFENAIKVPETLGDEKIAKKTPMRVAAKIISSAGPRYPSMAKRKGLELDVLVDFTIDINGRVKNIHFTKGSKVNYFKSAVRNAMAKWRFLPAQLNGEPVESQMSKIFSFSLLK